MKNTLLICKAYKIVDYAEILLSCIRLLATITTVISIFLVYITIIIILGDILRNFTKKDVISRLEIFFICDRVVDM